MNHAGDESIGSAIIMGGKAEWNVMTEYGKMGC